MGNARNALTTSKNLHNRLLVQTQIEATFVISVTQFDGYQFVGYDTRRVGIKGGLGNPIALYGFNSSSYLPRRERC